MILYFPSLYLNCISLFVHQVLKKFFSFSVLFFIPVFLLLFNFVITKFLSYFLFILSLRTSKIFFFFNFFKSFTCNFSWWSSWCRCNSFFRNNFDLFLFGRGLFFRNNCSTSIVSFGNNIFLCKSKVGCISSSSFFGKVIISSITTVQIIVSFEPLCELKVILILCFG